MEVSGYYRDFANALIDIGMSEERAVLLFKITEKSIYSKNGITDEEYKLLKNCYKESVKLILSRVSPIKRLFALIKIIK